MATSHMLKRLYNLVLILVKSDVDILISDIKVFKWFVFFPSYFENMERICSPKFIPTQRDVLRARVRTQGVIETCFRHKGVIIRYDYCYLP